MAQNTALARCKSVIAGLLLVLSAVWIVLKIFRCFVAVWHLLERGETALSPLFDATANARDTRPVRGLMALASGEGVWQWPRPKGRQIILKRPDLNNLLIAQAAELAGEPPKRKETYRKLADQRTQPRFGRLCAAS